VWGDITSPGDVLRAVDGVDCVLHPAALISPAADAAPEQARRVNVGGMANLLAAIRSQPQQGADIRFVSIGSVAQYGDRLPPKHWIRVGDPLMPSVFDYYALTKCEAECMLVESGLRHWASLRQTYIAIPDPLTLLDPIAFHQPPQQRIELITARDAGYGLVQCIDAPSDFWGRIYNMSGGPSCRIRYLDYLDRMTRIFGLGDYRNLFERNWFALRNFHCGYYEDSPALDAYTGHFREGVEDHLLEVERTAPLWMKTGARLCPKPLIKLYLSRMADPLRWIARGDKQRVNAFFGSLEAWQAIPGWHGEGLEVDPAVELDRPPYANPSLDSVDAFAESRGGRCVSAAQADPSRQLTWECAAKHRFEASPRLLIEGGYWCPKCAPNVADTSGWDYDHRSALDPLLGSFYNRG
jgi:nucleoside-diphosphate-sugar epimerase